jgi:hypothetical protein
MEVEDVELEESDLSNGWGGYYDERVSLEGLGAPRGRSRARLRGMGVTAADAFYAYTPDLSDVGHGPSYYPGDTTRDLEALIYVGYGDEAQLATHVGTTGTQQGDMDQAQGAWDPDFQLLVETYQRDQGLAPDGWIGPDTRRALLATVNLKNGAPPGPAPPGPSPLPVPPAPPPDIMPWIPPTPDLPQRGGIQPVSVKGTPTSTYVAIGVGALVLGGVAWWLSKS